MADPRSPRWRFFDGRGAAGLGVVSVAAGLGIDFGLYELSASFSRTNRRSVFAAEVIGTDSGGVCTIASGCLLGASITSRAIPPEVSLSLTIGPIDGRSGSASRSC